MTITDRLILLDKTLCRHNEGHWQEGYDQKLEQANLDGFSSFNDAGVECETGEYLYSMVRLLKPAHVLETGTHWGIGASYMGLALLDNGMRADVPKYGHLDTVEFLPEIHAKAQQRIIEIGLTEQVTCHFGDVANFQPGVGVSYDMILLDTEPQTRFAELLKFYPFVKEGGYIFIHDLHRHCHQIPNDEHGFAWPYGPMPEAIKQLVHEGKLRPFHFNTPRGLTGFYKVSGADYDWK